MADALLYGIGVLVLHLHHCDVTKRGAHMKINASGTRLFQSIQHIITGYSKPTVMKPHHSFC
jgi:hypothetical protein